MEQRHFKRVSFFTQAELALADQAYSTEIIDISLKGALVRKPAGCHPAPTQPLMLKIRLDDDTATITMQVTIAHQHADYLGLHCIAIDIESISHLRRLLELNLGDANLLQRELAELSALD